MRIQRPAAASVSATRDDAQWAYERLLEIEKNPSDARKGVHLVEQGVLRGHLTYVRGVEVYRRLLRLEGGRRHSPDVVNAWRALAPHVNRERLTWDEAIGLYSKLLSLETREGSVDALVAIDSFGPMVQQGRLTWDRAVSLYEQLLTLEGGNAHSFDARSAFDVLCTGVVRGKTNWDRGLAEYGEELRNAGGPGNSAQARQVLLRRWSV
jgi:hypothetical protein